MRLIAILILIHSICYAQERVQPRHAQYIDKVWELRSAIGWAKDEYTLQWKSAKNKIPGRTEQVDKKSKISNYYTEKWGLDNFYFIQLHRIRNNADTFYLLIVPFSTGEYEYPVIREDWYDYKYSHIYVLPYRQFQIVDSFTMKFDIIHFSTPILYQFDLLDYIAHWGDTWPNAIQICDQLYFNSISKSNESPFNYHIVIQPDREKNRVRFVATTLISDMFYGFPKCKYCHMIYPYDPDLFNSYYYEAPYNSLKGLLNY